MRESLPFMLRTFSNNPDCNSDCDYAIVKLYSPHLKQLGNRMDLAQALSKADDSFVCAEYADSVPEFFSEYEGLEHLIDLDTLVDGEPLLVAEAIVREIPKKLYQQVEECRMVVLPNHVPWEFRPRHSDVIIDTAEVGLEHLSSDFVRRGDRYP